MWMWPFAWYSAIMAGVTSKGVSSADLIGTGMQFSRRAASSSRESAARYIARYSSSSAPVAGRPSCAAVASSYGCSSFSETPIVTVPLATCHPQ